MDVLESSTREKTPPRRSLVASHSHHRRKMNANLKVKLSVSGTQHTGSVPEEEVKGNLQTSSTNGSNSARALRGTIRTLVGATTGGSEST